MDMTELRETRRLAVGDTLVSAAGNSFEITKLTRIGRGIRVHYVSPEGGAGRFTAAPEALSRVLRASQGAPASHVA